MASDFPLAEFDGDSAALMQPESAASGPDVPDRAVVCFFRDVIEEVCGEGRADVVAETTWESDAHRLFRLRVDGGTSASSTPVSARRSPAASSRR